MWYQLIKIGGNKSVLCILEKLDDIVTCECYRNVWVDRVKIYGFILDRWQHSRYNKEKPEDCPTQWADAMYINPIFGQTRYRKKSILRKQEWTDQIWEGGHFTTPYAVFQRARQYIAQFYFGILTNMAILILVIPFNCQNG